VFRAFQYPTVAKWSADMVNKSVSKCFKGLRVVRECLKVFRAFRAFQYPTVAEWSAVPVFQSVSNIYECLQVVTSVSKCCRVFQQPTVAQRSAVPVFKCFECFQCSKRSRMFDSVPKFSNRVVYCSSVSELMSIYSDSRIEECLNVDTVSFQSCLQSVQGSDIYKCSSACVSEDYSSSVWRDGKYRRDN
jgi:hypothetical protein